MTCTQLVLPDHCMLRNVADLTQNAQEFKFWKLYYNGVDLKFSFFNILRSRLPEWSLAIAIAIFICVLS